MTTSFEEVETIDDINPCQFTESDFTSDIDSLIHLVELKKIQGMIDLRREHLEYMESQWEIRVTHFERRKYFFMMFYCAIAASIATITSAIVFWGLSSHVCR